MMRDAEATTMREDMVEAAMALKWQSLDQPPMVRHAPRHKRMLERIAPSMEDCTIRISPRVRATVLTIISTALPNVAFSSAGGLWVNIFAMKGKEMMSRGSQNL